MDWSTFFPYSLLAVIILFSIGIYALITCKRFLQAVFGIEIMLMAANLLLLSFGMVGEGGTFTADPLAQVISLIVIIVGAAFAVIGVAIDKRLRKTTGTTAIGSSFRDDERADKGKKPEIRKD